VEEGVVLGIVVRIDQDLPPGVQRAQERADGVARVVLLDHGESGVGAVVVHVVEVVEPLPDVGAELLVVEDGRRPGSGGAGGQCRDAEEQGEIEESLSGPNASRVCMHGV
jgi:hypothetical protein